MSRIIFGGTLAPGQVTGLEWRLPTIFNPQGDWDGPPWTLAHPRAPIPPGTTTPRLETFNHGKFMLGGVYRYSFFVQHALGLAVAVFDIDHS
jgi:hypothetical protein